MMHARRCVRHTTVPITEDLRLEMPRALRNLSSPGLYYKSVLLHANYRSEPLSLRISYNTTHYLDICPCLSALSRLSSSKTPWARNKAIYEAKPRLRFSPSQEHLDWHTYTQISSGPVKNNEKVKENEHAAPMPTIVLRLW